MAHNANTDDEATIRQQSAETNHRAVCHAARDAGLSVYEFYAREPYVSFLDRNGCPSAAVLQPDETVVVIEYASGKPEYPDDGFAVSVTTASNDHTPEWELPETPTRQFTSLSDAVAFAASQF
jgi:hypothetical protein